MTENERRYAEYIDAILEIGDKVQAIASVSPCNPSYYDKIKDMSKDLIRTINKFQNKYQKSNGN